MLNTETVRPKGTQITEIILIILTIIEGHILLLRGNQVSVTYMGHVNMTQRNASQ